jgi:DNA-binding protein HU-beta
VNKAELVQALAERLDGDRKVAAAAVDGLLDVIVRTVHSGDSVAVTGFGVFERRERAARSGRNPRTGQVIEVAATSVPAFRPGAMFRDVVSGARELGEPVRHVRATGGSGTVNGAVAPVPTATALAVTVDAEPAGSATDTPAPAKPAKAAKSGKAAAKPAGTAKPAKTEKATKAAKAEPKPVKKATGKDTKAAKDATKDSAKKAGKGRKSGK